MRGERLSIREAEAGRGGDRGRSEGRDRLLALMDLGTTRARAEPDCDPCRSHASALQRGPLTDETRHRQAEHEGSFRQRRGVVMATLHKGRNTPRGELDGEALASLLDDGLTEVTHGRAHLPRS